MSTGADAKTMPQTAEFDEGYERTFGKDRKPVRGRWIWDAAQQKLVNVDEYVPPETALNAPIMVDRFMEGHVSQDGVDIGSRRKRKDYMRATGVTDASDYNPGHADRVKKARDEKVTKSTHETVARIAWTDPRWKP